MRSRTMVLADGRTLSWSELGADVGVAAVITNHGAGSSRLETAIFDGQFGELGLRVIAPERPGYGMSSPSDRGRTVVEWADDVASLVDLLGIDVFAVAGYSAGGSHALALAAAPLLAARVSRVLLRASWAPGDSSRTGRDTEIDRRANSLPWVEFSETFATTAFSDISMAAADEQAFATAGYLDAAIATLAEGARQGSLGHAGDTWANSRPWGFELKSVKQPVDIWHGDQDTLVPVANAIMLDAALSNSTLRVLADEGHFSIGRHVPEQFSVISSSAREHA
jgi:pimeloyl-ACP methyl ester carboxylesterase